MSQANTCFFGAAAHESVLAADYADGADFLVVKSRQTPAGDRALTPWLKASEGNRRRPRCLDDPLPEDRRFDEGIHPEVRVTLFSVSACRLPRSR